MQIPYKCMQHTTAHYLFIRSSDSSRLLWYEAYTWVEDIAGAALCVRKNSDIYISERRSYANDPFLLRLVRPGGITSRCSRHTRSHVHIYRLVSK